MKTYKVTCERSYSIMNGPLPKLDTYADYVIVDKSLHFPHCVIIERADKKEYLGNNRWIVPERHLKLVTI